MKTLGSALGSLFALSKGRVKYMAISSSQKVQVQDEFKHQLKNGVAQGKSLDSILQEFSEMLDKAAKNIKKNDWYSDDLIKGFELPKLRQDEKLVKDERLETKGANNSPEKLPEHSADTRPKEDSADMPETENNQEEIKQKAAESEEDAKAASVSEEDNSESLDSIEKLKDQETQIVVPGVQLTTSNEPKEAVEVACPEVVKESPLPTEKETKTAEDLNLNQDPAAAELPAEVNTQSVAIDDQANEKITANSETSPQVEKVKESEVPLQAVQVDQDEQSLKSELARVLEERAKQSDAQQEPLQSKPLMVDPKITAAQIVVPNAPVLDVQGGSANALLLKASLESVQLRINESSKSISPIGPSALSMGAGIKKDNSSATEAQNKPNIRQLTRQDASRTLERVECVLKEVAKSKDGRTISVRLDPPSLGNLKVDMTLRDGVLHARIVAEVAQVANLLRDKAHELQAILRKLGLSSDQVNVSVRSEDNSQSTGGAGEQSFSGQGDEREMPRFLFGKSTLAEKGISQVTNVVDHWVA